MQMIATIIIRIVALFYLYGAAVHVMNILGLSGFDWSEAPFKWQLLDMIYLVLDIYVVTGFFLDWKSGYLAFYIAAFSQIVLYTIFRDWIIDVPADFALEQEQVGYLTTLVIFHCVTLFFVSLAFYRQKEKLLAT